jgi:hypothetical protein
MQWTRLKPMRSDRYLASAFVYNPEWWGDYGKVVILKGQVWLMMMKNQFKSEVIVIGGESGLFASRDI